MKSVCRKSPGGTVRNQPGQERKLYLDVLRVLAVFLICYNHSFAFELYLNQAPDGSLISWINVATAVLTTIHLPLFFMLSGALLLGKQESYRVVFTKRIWRFLVLLVCGSGATYLLLGETPLRFDVFIKNLLSGDIYMDYWFLYAYLSLLLAKPLLQKIAMHLSGSDILFLLVLRIVFFSGKMILDGCSSIFGMPAVILSPYFQLPFSSFDILFYPLAGYYLSEKLSLENFGKKGILGCIAVLILGTVLTSALVYGEGYFLGFTQNYITLFSYSSAMAVFILVRYGMRCCDVPEWLRKSIVSVSSVSIGIYILHPIVCHNLFLPFFRGVPWTVPAITVASIGWCLVCMVLCGGLTYLLRKIPGVKKYL